MAQFTIRLSDAEAEAVKKMAASLGISVNEFARMRLLQSQTTSQNPAVQSSTEEAANQPVQPSQPELSNEEIHWVVSKYLAAREEATDDYDSSLPMHVFQQVDRLLSPETEKINQLAKRLGTPAGGLLYEDVFHMYEAVCQLSLSNLGNCTVGQLHDIYKSLLGSPEHEDIRATPTRFGFDVKPTLSRFKNALAARFGWSGRQVENRLGALLYAAGLDDSDFRTE